MNRIAPEELAPEECPRAEGTDVLEKCADYLQDESRLTAGEVDVVYFPEEIAHVAWAVRDCAEAGEPLTVSGGRTGIVGGAVPAGARRVLSLARMNRLKAVRGGGEKFSVVVEPGMSLDELKTTLEKDDWPDDLGRDDDERASAADLRSCDPRPIYPIDPTEMTAHVGGTISTNASGARSYRYGPTRAWVEGLKVVLADGRLASLERGKVLADGLGLVVEGLGELELPRLKLPRVTCTAGYYVLPGMDALDLFIGAEGTLGIVVEAELRLTAPPPGILSLTAFLPDGADGMDLVARAREKKGLDIVCLEYLDGRSLELLRRHAGENPQAGVPPFPASARSAVFLEAVYETEDDLDRAVGKAEKLLGQFGASMDDTWAGFEPDEAEKMRAFRHALPEAVNSLIGRLKASCPAVHKVGTDAVVPDESMPEMMRVYREALDGSGMEYVLFGHAGDNHLHANLIPHSEEELARALNVARTIARRAVELGGAVSGEHGLGRIKRDLLPIQHGPEGVEGMRRIERFFDPEGLLNPGVLLPD